MTQAFDLIIIGAGPSGTTCAYHVKKQRPQTRILLIDKAHFPRYKTCGGGISKDVLNYFDFSLDEAVSFQCTQAVMIANQKLIQTPIPETYMVRRDVFDNFLLEKTKEKGVVVKTNCAAQEVNRAGKLYAVKTTQGVFHAPIVVIAEGGKGTLARKLNIAPANDVLAALEYEHFTHAIDENLYINFDHNEKGYAWSFPKQDGLSLGIGSLIKGKEKAKDSLPTQLKQFVRRHQVTALDRQHLHGHPIQLYSGRHNLVHGGILLIGEIAGCVDPLTAEGIRPAIKSGYLAAGVLTKAFNTAKMRHLKQYNRLFHREIGRDFRYARIMAYFINRYRETILPLVISTFAVEKFMEVFTGKAKYSDHISPKRIAKMVLRTFKMKKG